MNKNRFRIIFNQLRGLLMVVAEHVKSYTMTAESGTGTEIQLPAYIATRGSITAVMRPLAFSLMLALGTAAIILPNPANISVAHAEVKAATNVPGNQQPIILNAPNGVETVNIQTPSAAGVSHNVYEILNVPQQGVIFNNSHNNVQTELGGWIQGNPFLAGGEAHIILNEINSSNPSYLNGFMEIAGSQAELIIANPNGISCNGCGFINASRSVLTTGTPILSGGDLTGYRVTGGSINIWGNGLDASRSNYTDIIARAVEINAGIWANDLNIITGTNQVEINSQNTGSQHIGNISTIAPDPGSVTPAFAVDVAALGGMYAGKIHLIGTEAGLGVNNAGVIAAGVGELMIDVNGNLANSNIIAGTTQTGITADNVNNTDASITSVQQLDINTGSLSGDGRIHAGGDVTVNLIDDYTQTSNGALQANGNLMLNTGGNILNQSAILSGQTLTLNAANIDNTAAAELSGLNTYIDTTGTLSNRGLIDGSNTFITANILNNLGTGAIFGDHVAIAADTLNNLDETVNGITTSAVIAARDRMDVGARIINNHNNALIFSSGDIAIGGALDANHEATLGAGQPQADTLINNGASIEALGDLQLSVVNLNNLNSSLVTKEVQVATGNFHLFTPRGRSEVLNADDYPLWQIGNFNISWRYGSVYDVPFNFREYYRYIGSTVTTETQVISSNPGQILSGGDMYINGNITNQDSKIIAGGLLDISGANLNNLNTQGQVVTSYTGKAYYYDYDGNESCSDPGDGCYDIGYVGPYNPANEVITFNLPTTEVKQNTTPNGSNTSIATLSPNVLPNNSLFQPSPDSTANYLIETNPSFANYKTWLSSDYMLTALSYDPATTMKRLGDGFYEQRLIREQIAQLTGQRFLEGYSDDEAQYQALMSNGITFAQQYQLIPGVALTDAQIAQLTSDIVWLVEQTVTLADGTTVQALVPQIYVTLQPGDLDGSGSLLAGSSINLNLSEEASNSGSIAGRTVVTINADTINNLGGNISGNNTQLQANQDINNLGGSLSGNESLILSAGNDINIASTTQSTKNQNGASSFSRTNLDRIAGLYVDNPNGILVVSAGNDLNLQAAAISNSGENGTTVLNAGNDLNLTTITTAEQNNTIKNSKNYIKHGTTQEIGTVIQTEGDLILNAGNDLSASAADVTSNNGALTVMAGNNVTIEAGEASSNLVAARTTKKKGTFSSKKTESLDAFNDTDVISSTFSGNTVDISAGNNLTVTGSNVVGTNDVNLNAQNNITIESAQATHDESHYYKEKKTGFTASSTSIGYSSSKLTTTNDSQQVMNVGSIVGSVEGDVNISTGNQYTQTASDVLTPAGDINITAQQVDITAATDTYANQQTMEYKQTGITLAISNPVISAVQTANQMAEAASHTSDSRMQALAAGVTALAVSNAADALGTVDQYGNVPTAGNTGPNDMTNVTEANAADKVGGINLSISIGTSKASSSSSQNINTVNGSTLSAGGNINITATGVPAGGIPAVVSQQVGNNSVNGSNNPDTGNINVTGSQITAAHDVNLTAQNAINLQAAANTQTLDSENDSSSTSIGVSVSLGANTGVGITAGVSKGKGKANGNDTTWTETTIQGGNQQGDTVTLNSGTDTNLIGAQVIGNQVIANVGTSGTGNLNIQSLQDSSSYDSKQKSAGISVTVPVTGTGWGGSVSASNSKVNSDYASVNEQAGIFAGDEGFQVNVNGNTNLTGAVIASTEQAIQNNANNLTTQTLTTSNIENSAAYEADSTSLGIGYSTSGNDVGTNQKGEITTGANQTPNSALSSLKGFSASMPVAMSASDEADSTTLSGISGGTVTITDNATQQTTTGKDANTTVANLNRDVHTQLDTTTDDSGNTTTTAIAVDSNGNNLANTLAPIYTEEVQQEIDAGFEIVGAFVREVSVYVAHRTQEAATIKQQAQSKLNEAANTTDPVLQSLLLEQAANLNIQAAEIEANWGMGGDYRILATALTGALSGNITGSGADIIQSAAVNYLQSLAVSEIKDIADSLGSETARTALQAVAACAGAAAQGNDCGTGALGASAAVVISNLIDSVNNSNASSLTAEEKQARENLVATLVTGIALAAGLDTATANTAAQIELENNNLRLVVSTAKIVAKIGSAIKKTGKVTGEQLKEIIKGEGLDIIDDARTLLDGELNYEDALVLINIIAGIDLKGLSKLEIADKLGKAISKVTKTEVKVVDRAGARVIDTRLPISEPTRASNGLMVESNAKHTPATGKMTSDAGTEPKNSLDLFEGSISTKDSNVRLTLDNEGNVHRFFDDGSGIYHWSGSTADARAPLTIDKLRQAGFAQELRTLGVK